ncbi:hypothetical protein [Providencia vermicola]|uniref:hypothetical protein n=1 Tax=Providencia vermicola TaxID=333965 RepID=UPI0034DD36D6
MLSNKIIMVTRIPTLMQSRMVLFVPTIKKCIPEENNFPACEALANQGDDEALLIVGRFYETALVSKKISKRQKKFIRDCRIRTMQTG